MNTANENGSMLIELLVVLPLLLLVFLFIQTTGRHLLERGKQIENERIEKISRILTR